MKKKWQLKILALLIAVFLWFQQSLIRDYSQEINIPIEIVNIPNNFIIFSTTTNFLSFEVTARGFDLLLMKFKKKITYKIDAKNFKYWKNTVPISSKYLVIPKNIKLNKIKYFDKYQKIDIVLDKLIRAKKNIIPTFTDQNTSDFFRDKNIKLSPALVTVIGPKSIVKQISGIPTEKISISDFKKQTSLIKLVYLTPKIKIYPDQTYLKSDKNIYQTKIFNNVKIKVPENFKDKIIPNFIIVKIKGKNDDIDKITVNDIDAIISKINKDSTAAEINVKINKNVEILEFTPRIVQVLK